MTNRRTQLLDTANAQIAELRKLLSIGDEPVLQLPCSGRQKLGDGTVGAVTSHIVSTYNRIAALSRGEANTEHNSGRAHHHPVTTQSISVKQLLKELSVAQCGLAGLADLSDEQLDSVPPAGTARFCDGNRTLEQVLANMLKHQGHQVDAVIKAAAASGVDIGQTEKLPQPG